VFSNEQRLRNLVAQRALQREKSVFIRAEDTITDLGS